MENENVEYAVTFKSSIENRINLIKTFRALTGARLRPSKNAIESLVSHEELSAITRGESDSYSFTIIMNEEEFGDLSKNLVVREANGVSTEITVESVREISLPETYERLSG